MRNFALVIFILFVNVLTQAQNAQNVSVSKQNVKIVDLFEEIENQTNMTIAYNESTIDVNRTVSVNISNKPVLEAMSEILKGTRATCKIQGKQILIVPEPQQIAVQNGNRVTGTVIDENGEALSGAIVVEKGVSNGTVTDGDGKFTLEVSPGATLAISYLGYNIQEIATGNRTDLKITLTENSLGLEEVIVVGYGTQKKVNLTGAVSTISAEKLTQVPSSNLTNSVAGRLSGVIATNPNGLPGSGSNLQIRGLSTLNNNSPLVVIDGIVGGDFSTIDPNEIQSISVLKDASAAVYGARAANGVFLVTTKRGKMGKPKISYTGMFGVQQPTQYTDLMNSYEYASTRNIGRLNQGYDPTNPAQASQFYTEQELANFKSGAGIDWHKETLRNNSPETQHNLSVNGGTEMIRYFMSLGYLDQSGILLGDINYKRYNIRANVDAKITKYLDVGMNLEGRLINNQTLATPILEAYWDMIACFPTFTSAYYPDGRPVDTSATRNPVENQKNGGYQRQKTDVFQGTLFFEQRLPFITEGLSVRGNASFFRQFYFDKRFVRPWTQYVEDEQGNITSSRVMGTALLREEFSRLNRNVYNISLNYARIFGKHDIAGALIYEQSEEIGDNMNGTKQDYSTYIKEELYASGTANQSFTGTSVLNEARRSLIGRANYAYNSKYLLEFSFRYDGSYRFPKEQRFGFFPSVSVGWRISEEAFFKNASALSFIDNLKIRASKGLIGNDRVNAFQYMDAYSINSGSGPVIGGAPQTLINYGVYPNPNITWEKQDNNNIGLEASFWKGKLSAEIDVFYRKTRDILWSRDRSVPGTFGRSLPNENYAQMQSQGLDLNIGYRDNIGKVQYNVQLTGTYATNKVTQIDDPSSRLDYEKQLNRPIGFRVGYESLGFFQSDEEAAGWYGGKQFGLITQAGDIKYADVDNDGEISNSDQKVLSNNGFDPRMVYGVSIGLKWKNFDFDLFAQGAALRTMLIQDFGRVLFTWGICNPPAYLLDYWTPENRDAKYPLAWVDSRSINDRTSSVWLKNAAYLRLKSASLGYTFTHNLLKQIGIDRLRLYVSGFNLFTWSQFKEFDPEAESGSGRYYPQQRNLNIGINLTF